MRERRRVKKDNTLSVAGTQWELDQGLLAGRLVTVVRCLVPGAGPPAVEHQGKRLVLHPTDPVNNGKRKRTPIAPPPPSASTVLFDPPTVLLDRAVGRSVRKKEGSQ